MFKIYAIFSLALVVLLALFLILPGFRSLLRLLSKVGVAVYPRTKDRASKDEWRGK